MRISEFPVISEIKDEYLNHRRNQQSRSDTVECLKNIYRNELSSGCCDDALLFWIGLADAQYAAKELESEVAQQALSALDAIVMNDWDICIGDITRRKTRYASAPMPERQKFGKSRKFRCSWEIGDTFAYRLDENEAQAYGLEGKYVLLRKVDETEKWDGRLCPVVTFTLWGNPIFPSSSAEFCSEPIMILNKPCLCPPGIYQYRTELLVTSAKKLKQLGLVYIGNFRDVEMPSNEHVICMSGCTIATTEMTPLDRFTWECCTYWKNHCIWSEEKKSST